MKFPYRIQGNLTEIKCRFKAPYRTVKNGASDIVNVFLNGVKCKKDKKTELQRLALHFDFVEKFGPLYHCNTVVTY